MFLYGIYSIDENFIYCDTDSLYFKKKIQHKIPNELFTEFELGTWELEHDNLVNFYVLNHKKYAYETEDGKIKVRAGGIPNDSFNTDMTFDRFIETQFSDGIKINNLKSIYNKQGTISIYPSTTKLEVGKGYRIKSNGKYYNKMKEHIFKQAKEQAEDTSSDVLYIESTIGTFSLSELYPYTHEVKKKEPLVFLEIKQDQMKQIIER